MALREKGGRCAGNRRRKSPYRIRLRHVVAPTITCELAIHTRQASPSRPVQSMVATIKAARHRALLHMHAIGVLLPLVIASVAEDGTPRLVCTNSCSKVSAVGAYGAWCSVYVRVVAPYNEHCCCATLPSRHPSTRARAQPNARALGIRPATRFH